MADVPGSVVYDVTSPYGAIQDTRKPGAFILPPGGVVLRTYYKMRGIDQTCAAGLQPAYVHWVSEEEPDLTASLLTPADLPCGSNPSTDVIDIHIAAVWRE